MRHSLSLALAFALIAPALASAKAPLPGPVALQNALFEEQFENDLREDPESATALGDYRYNDKLAEYSLAAMTRRHASDQAFLARLKRIPTTGFSDQDRLSHDLLVRVLGQRLADFDLKNYELSLDQLRGIHMQLADLPLAVPFDSVKQYEDYAARLRQIPRVLAESTDVLRAGMRDRLMPVRFLAEKIPAQCEGIIEANPFLLPTRQYPEGVSAADQERLTRQITEAVQHDVVPAYRSFAEFVRTTYAPAGRTSLGITSLPDGQRRYANAIYASTTTRRTPEAIHALGLSEMARIQSEMTAIAQKQGFADLPAFRASLKTNPKCVPTSAEQILDGYRRYIAQMEPRLPELFTLLPDSPVTVEAIPDFQKTGATHYITGTPDGKRPGRVVVATSRLADRTMVNDEAIAYHEGVPGHHMQLSVQQKLTGLPRFRLHGVGFNAYSEGWALYSEQLGKEIGFYQDPVSDYGRLSSELFRAVRLVVDTGIHAKGWSRDQVVEFMRKAAAVDEASIQSETDRYIAWPAQALSYKLGQLKFRELRDRAQKQLGAKFDIRRFHDQMLNGGTIPLDMLEARTEAWIAQEAAR
jgi:uncharacterized protein (DUF885 family)